MNLQMMQALKQASEPKEEKIEKEWGERTFYEKCGYYCDKSLDKIKSKSHLFFPFLLAICVRSVYTDFKGMKEKGQIPEGISPTGLTIGKMVQGFLPLPLSF